MSHRVVVMCEGRITGELNIAEATQEKIMQYATQRSEALLADESAPTTPPQGEA
jgi:ribose transport system ATP-binding protein